VKKKNRGGKGRKTRLSFGWGAWVLGEGKGIAESGGPQEARNTKETTSNRGEPGDQSRKDQRTKWDMKKMTERRLGEKRDSQGGEKYRGKREPNFVQGGKPGENAEGGS